MVCQMELTNQVSSASDGYRSNEMNLGSN
jgi:hypothetical protein